VVRSAGTLASTRGRARAAHKANAGAVPAPRVTVHRGRRAVEGAAWVCGHCTGRDDRDR